MNALLQFLVDHGLVLLTGTTAVLALGALFMLCQRSPVHRQRIGEMTILATLVWLVLTCAPLPRLSLKPDRPIVRPEPPAALPEISAATLVEDPRPNMDVPEQPIQFDEAIVGIIEYPPEAAASAFPQIVPPPTPLDWPRAAARAYLLGVAACTAWILLGHILLRRLLRAAHAPEPWLADLFHELNAPSASRLLISPTASRPISCGLLRPTIILPQRCASPDRLQQLRQVLRHELAHVAQADSLGHALFNLALPLLYFHPFYWLIRARTFLARELVADDRAAAAADSKESYVSELIALAAQRFASPRQPGRMNVIGIFESTTHFYRRMHMLLQRQSPLATRCSTWWRITAVLTASLLIGSSTLFVGVNRAHAQAAPDRERDQEIATLRAERDQLATRLADMEKRFQQMQAQMQAMRAEVQTQQAERRRRIRTEEDQRRSADPNSARVQLQPIPLDAGAAVEYRAEMQREQGMRELASKIDEMSPAELKRLEEELTTEQKRELYRARQGMQQQRRPEPQSERASSPRAPQLDLIALANAYIDATGNERLREIQLQRIARLEKDKVASQSELETAQVELDMAQRKARLFRAMAEAALRAAEAELQNAKQHVETGLASINSVHDAESKVLVLRQILSN